MPRYAFPLLYLASLGLWLSNVTATQVPQPWQARPQWNFQSSSGTHELLVNINSGEGKRRQTHSPAQVASAWGLGLRGGISKLMRLGRAWGDAVSERPP